MVRDGQPPSATVAIVCKGSPIHWSGHASFVWGRAPP
jgi:hypothetical protein